MCAHVLLVQGSFCIEECAECGSENAKSYDSPKRIRKDCASTSLQGAERNRSYLLSGNDFFFVGQKPD